MNLLVFLLLFSGSVWGEEGWSAPYIVTQSELQFQPPGSQLLAVSMPIQDVWIKGIEEEPFPGTNRHCQTVAFDKTKSGWTWQPNTLENVPYENENWDNFPGTCRLYTSSVTKAFYAYSHGQSWAFAMTYLRNEQDHACPRNVSKFVGVSKKGGGRSAVTYNVPALTHPAMFCLVSAEASPGCQPISIYLDGGRSFEVWNATIVEKDPLFCSVMKGGCGARLPLFELYDGKTFTYSTKYEDINDGWKQLCWVWSHDHC